MEIVIIVGLILLNGVLSMSEIAMVSARKSRLEADVKKEAKPQKPLLNWPTPRIPSFLRSKSALH